MRPSRFSLVLALAMFISALGPVAAHAQQATASPEPAAATSGSPPPVPPPKPGPDDPQRHKLAVQQFLAWQNGQVDRTHYDDSVNSELSDDVLDSATRTLANMGALQSAVYLGTSYARGAHIFVYKMTCEHGSVDMDFALDPDGKIGLIFFE
jgi:hypothetical protein